MELLKLSTMSMFDEVSAPVPDAPTIQIASVKSRKRKPRLKEYQYSILDVFGLADDHPNQDEFSEVEIYQLRAWMFTRHLRLMVDDRAELENQQEVLDWFMDDSIHPFCARLCFQASYKLKTDVGEWLEFVSLDTLRREVLVIAKKAGLDVSTYLDDL